MKLKSDDYSLLKKYLIRVPLLSFDEVQNLNNEKILELCEREDISKAIYLASPDLHKEMVKCLESREGINDKLILSLAKYILRMGTRSTPFGLFSGCDVGVINDKKTKIELSKITSYKTKTRLDMNYLCSLSQELEKVNDVRKNLEYFPNNSIYSIGNELRYVEYRYVNSERYHYLISVESNEYLKKIIENVKFGMYFNEIVELIVNEEVSRNDSIDYINLLIENQILTSSISPNVAGRDYLGRILEKLPVTYNVKWLNDITEILKKIDKYPFKHSIDLYEDIQKKISSQNISFNKKYIIQSDLIVNTEKNEIGSDIIKTLRKGLTVLNKLKVRSNYKNLEDFKVKFHERFEEEMIPLSIALDVESGIGYGNKNSDSYSISPLIDDLNLSNSEKNEIDFLEFKRNKLDAFFHNKILDCFLKNENEIKIKDSDLNKFEEKWDVGFPKTMSCLVKIIYDKSDNPKIIVKSISGSSASILMGRFGHTHDNIYNLINDIFVEESHMNEEDFINAEIVHLPEARVGNILGRKNQRKYEIPYLAFSTLDIERKISINDLYVKIEQGKVLLFSKKLNKYVNPFLSNAHGFWGNSLPIYNFLGDLQLQNLYNSLSFSWEDILSRYKFLPRVSYENVIFSVAQWNLNRYDINKVNIKNIDNWRKDRKIPDLVLISEGDNELFIDFRNILSQKLFLKSIKNKEAVVLKEYIETNKHLVNRKGVGFESEVIFSIII